MRNVFMLSTAVLLASTSVVSAQQTATTAPAPAPAAVSHKQDALNSAPQVMLNLGYRGSSSEGDQARWERYRDLRSGVLGSASFKSENEKSALHFSAENVGYHDQKYTVDYNNFGKLKFSALWNSIPLNYAYNTLTPWKDAGNNVWTLDSNARTAVENKTALGIGTTAADFNTPSIYRGLATPFAMQSRRDILNLGMKYRLTDALGLNLGFNSIKRGGTQPFGGSFAFNNANERPMTIDDRNNEMTAGVEWAKPSTGMLRVQWAGTWYKNQFQSLTWDNPLRATNYNNGKAPPAGPFDASGYSNGNGPAVGRLALPPSNSMNSVSLVGLRKLPSRSTLNGSLSIASMKQDADLIPWTTNANIANAAVYAFFPGLAQLPRASAQADVRAINALLNFTTHPTDKFAFDMRYRFNDHENRTPAFDASNNVRFDAVPEAVPGTETEHFNIRQNTFETGATFTMPHNSSLRFGYILDDVKREGRAAGNVTDYTFRASLDTYGNQYLMLRGVFENTRRRDSGFNEELIVEGGAQPDLRFYDEAAFNRNKGTLILQLTPSDKFDMDLSLASGKDVYNGEGQEFGLLDNSNSSYNVTLNVYPAKKLTLGGNYGYEKFNTLQASRNANPPATTGYNSWTDANRNWDLENGETVKNAGLYADLSKVLLSSDIRLSYDRSSSDNAFVYSGPRIREFQNNTALTPGDGSPCGVGLASCFSQLPDVTNTWQQLRVDVTRMFNKKYGLSAGYSYEKLDIVDFATSNLADGTPRIDPLGAITTGYGNRPYKGQTFMVKLLYLFQSAPVM